MAEIKDCIIIGGGQSGLACSYFLRRSKLDYCLLDNQEKSGGSWLHAWDSLKLFSPAEFSSIPGWMMPRGKGEYPTRDEVLDYFSNYEGRYDFPILRPVHVKNVSLLDGVFHLETNQGEFLTRALISATGTWQNPYLPSYPGQELFSGEQVHSSRYKNSDPFQGKRVLVIGGGNSGAQILAEVSKVANATWVTLEEPVFLPDYMDGRYLFYYASAQYQAQQEGRPSKPTGNLGDIVMIESVKEARSRGVLTSVRPFDSFTETGVDWSDGREEKIDAVIWCTGFKSSLGHLSGLEMSNVNGKIPVKGTRSTEIPGLWLVGYGSWTGFASATLIGVGRTARQTSKEVQAFLSQSEE